jgi:SAM-dependent methyltransferase
MDWFDDETFWRELYPYMFPPERFAVAGEQADQLIALTKCTAGAALDLCCGPGRHAIALAQRGFAVTGVDRTACLLDRARERAALQGAAIEWVLEDMRRFCRPEAFDLVCNLFTSFGYFDNRADDLQVLRNLHASLKDSGVLVMEMIGKERLARVWQSAICTEHPDGSMLIQRPKVVKDWCRIQNEWTIIRGGRAQTFCFEHAIYSGCELRDLLLASGFSEVQLFGSLLGAPYDLEANRLVAVARKTRR